MAESVGSVSLDLILNSKEFSTKLKKSVNDAVGDANKSVSGLKSVTAGLAKTVAAAFAVKKIVDFGKSCLELGSDLAEVQNVVDSTFTTMSDSVNEFASTAITNFGLSETVAKRYVGTFGAMAKAFGFTEKEALGMAETLTGLSGDVASFYNLSSDEAYTKLKSVFTGETESLKELGVVMTQSALDAYAMANGFGKTTKSMTEQEKVALRMAFVTDKLSTASGDFARTSDSWANQTRVLTLQFQAMQAQLGQGLIQVLTPVIKVINQLMAKLVSLATMFSQTTASIFGKQDTVTSVKNAANLATTIAGVGDAATGTAKDTAKAAKKMSKSLMNFDQINKLNDNSDSSAGAGSGGVSVPIFDTAASNKTLDSTLKNGTDKIKKWMSTLPKLEINADWKLVKSNLKTGLENVFATLKNLATLVITIAINILNDLDLGRLIENLSELWKSATNLAKQISAVVTPALIAFYEHGIKPIVKWIGKKLADALSFVSGLLDDWAKWFSDNKQKIVDFAAALGDLVAGFWAVIEPLLDAAWAIGKGAIQAVSDVIQGLFSFILDNKDGVITAIAAVVTAFAAYKTVVGISSLITGVSKSVAAFKDVLSAGTVAEWAAVGAQKALNLVMSLNPIGLVVAAIAGLVAATVVLWKKNEAFRNFWKATWDTIKTIVSGAVTAITGFFKNLGTAISTTFYTLKNTVSTIFSAIKSIVLGVVNGIKNAFSTAFLAISGIFTAMKNTFQNAMNGMLKVAKSPINGIIGLINGLISGLNMFIRAANKIKFDVPEWVPGIGGKKFGFNIPTIDKIPALAEGGYVKPNTPQLAMIGDNRHQGEIVAPEGKIASIVGEQLTPILTAINNLIAVLANNNNGDSGDIYIPVTIGGTTIDNIVVTAQQRQKLRSGGR